MKKILSVVGARPQFIKCAPVSRAVRKEFEEVLVHTGQHYDSRMSMVFFNELNIPEPQYNLGVGSSSHGEQTGRMLIELEKVLLSERPDLVLVYGDTNSTLAGSLAAAKQGIMLAHVEAGLRSFNRLMPEEHNRVCADHLSDILLCPTETACRHLQREGIVKNVFNVGDVMLDATLQNLERIDQIQLDRSVRGLKPKQYYFLTLHRQENTNDTSRLMKLLEMIGRSKFRTVFPVHPRTRAVLGQLGITSLPGIVMIDPVTYLESLALQKGSSIVITDSGGIQKEAYFLGVPCITLREETEWPETVEDGMNSIVGMDEDKFRSAEERFGRVPPKPLGNHFGDGHSSERIVEVLRSLL